MAFIEKLDAAALNLTPEEFQHFMQGRHQHTRNYAAKQGPPAVCSDALRPAADRGSEAQQRGQEVRTRLEELKGRQERVQQGALSLQEQLQHWVRDIHLQLDRVCTAQMDDLTATEVRADDDVEEKHVPDYREVLLLQEERPDDTCRKKTDC